MNRRKRKIEKTENIGNTRFFYTKLIGNKIRSCMELGASFRQACHSVGIPGDVGKRWLKKGKDGDEKYIDFYKMITISSGKCCVNLVETVRKHGGSKGAMWLLERLYPDDYGRSDNLKVESNNKNLSVNYDRKLSESERTEIDEKLAKFISNK